MAETKRWRAEEEHEFYYIKITHEGIDIYASWEESFDDYCQLMYNFGNYFRAVAEAQAAADEMRKVLLRHSGELHDFTWAVAEMEKGEKVCRKGRIESYHKYMDYTLWCDYGLSYEDLIATDWEIYEDNPSQ